MQIVLKWIAQMLLIPLITSGCKALLAYYKEQKELSDLRKQNQKLADQLKASNDKQTTIDILNKLH